jgi:hypothetical protein
MALVLARAISARGIIRFFIFKPCFGYFIIKSFFFQVGGGNRHGFTRIDEQCSPRSPTGDSGARPFHGILGVFAN